MVDKREMDKKNCETTVARLTHRTEDDLRRNDSNKIVNNDNTVNDEGKNDNKTINLYLYYLETGIAQNKPNMRK